MLQNAERIFFIFVNPAISLVIIALNSTVIYKMVKSTKRTGQSAKNMETKSASLSAKERVQSGSCEIHEPNFRRTEKSQGTFKKQLKKKKEIQQKIPIQKKNISKYMILLLNLAISDLLIGVAIIFYILLMFIKMHIDRRTLLFVMGFLISCLLPTSLLVSLANLQLAAILKFYAILRPFKYRSIKNRFIIKICLLQWVLITLPVTIDYTFTYLKHTGLYHSKFYQVIIPPLIFTAIIALAITYFLIFKSIQNRVAVGESHNVNQNKEREKALKTCLYRVISFTMFWLPTSGWGIYEICTENRNQPTGKVLSYFVLLNPVMNPLIYIFVFRKQA